MDLLWAILLVLVLLLSWTLTLVGMPGNWLMVAVAAVYVILMPAQSPLAIGWTVVVVLLVLAILGELAELVAGALGVARFGGSRRGATMALVGSLVGGILGLFLGLPIPLIGSLLASIMLAALGAMLGAYLGERWQGRNAAESWQIGKQAFRGRLLGAVAKAAVGILMILVTLVALIW